ncbi:MAG: DUF2232 domain-containing protein [Alphaproteobacteria bacterium]|nr:DUF2232 domain-containing protein [Alphaproteobacteria bacterium]MDP6517742.1 DUF2232 domain-containing protein [Alphaproteobacteria bacterium]
MTTAFAIAAIGGLLSALLFLSAMGGPALILLQYITQLPLFVVGLALGLGPAVVAGVIASAVTFLVDSLPGVIFAVGYALPVVLAIRQALLTRVLDGGQSEWYPPGRLLANATGYAAAILVMAALWMSGADDGMAGVVIGAIQQVLQVLSGDQIGPEAEGMIAQYAFLFPGLIGMSWIFMMVINGALAQGLVSGAGRNLRPTPSFVEIELPDWPAYALGGSALIWLIGGGNIGFAAGALFVIVLAPFFLQGIAVVHVLARRRATRSRVVITLTIFYILLIFLQWPMILVAVLGVVEQWAHVRRRLAAS